MHMQVRCPLFSRFLPGENEIRHLLLLFIIKQKLINLFPLLAGMKAAPGENLTKLSVLIVIVLALSGL